MKKLKLAAAIYSIVLMSGCASSGEQAGSIKQDYEAELNARNLELSSRNKELSASNQELAARNKEIAELKQKLNTSSKPVMQSAGMDTQAQTNSMTSVSDSSKAPASDSLLPPNAKAGQCFARVYTPPTYRTDTETVLKAEEYDVVNIKPAVYGTEEKTVMTREATEELTIIPAVYGWKEEQVLVSPAITELQRVPAKYRTEESRLLVKPAHSVWKKGTGPITKVNETTGEIMCLVEVPAVYETVKKSVLVTPETTKPVVVKAAVYKTVKTRVVKEPARTVTRIVPAVYETVKVKKLIEDSSVSSVKVPAVYETVKTTTKVADGYLEWAPILCETNVNGDVIRQLQKVLNDKNYEAGPVDGVYGWRTTNAVRKYQKDNEMAGDGQLTIELVEALQLKY